MLKVRFAPSPTGSLHLGSARTALFNFLFAKNKGGKFILRIEDSDRQRSNKEMVEEILDDLRWLGLQWDECPYFQSERIDVYRKYAEQLLNEKKAYEESHQSYPCTLAGTGGHRQVTSHRSPAKPNTENRIPKTKAIIFKVHPRKIKINDLIHKEIEFDASVIKDQVLIKSDGFPAYNFACVVDDYEMGISHIIRGDDHISNIPKQVMFYQALGWQVPKFAHIPLIMEPGGGRLSKRYGATAVGEYRKRGYLPEAMVNYLALLGWAPAGNREIVSLSEMISKFSLSKINKAKAIFNIDKLNWLNAQYIKQAETKKLVDLCAPFLQKDKLISDDYDSIRLEKIIDLFKGRLKYLSQISEMANYFFLPSAIEYSEEAKQKIKKLDKKIWDELIKQWGILDDFSSENIERVCRQIIAEQGIKGSELIHPLRVALTNMPVGPGLFELISVLGKEKTIERLKYII